jgi:hypothetical protein
MDPYTAENPYAALMARKAQLLAQEAQMNGQPIAPIAPIAPGQQAGFSGYGMARPQPTPAQLAQLAALLQKR